jgi:hypothetical protein
LKVEMFHADRLRDHRAGKEGRMAKGQKAAEVKARAGVRIPGFDLALHRGVRAVAARRGVPAYKLYEQIVRAFLVSAGEPAA